MKRLPDVAHEWLAFADEDLRSAEVLLAEGIYNQACFHAQQCVEKLLKALLLVRGEHLPKVHDLNELFERCVAVGALEILQFRERVATLSLYYVPTRYPDAIVGSLPDGLPNKKDADEAVENARTIARVVRKSIGTYHE